MIVSESANLLCQTFCTLLKIIASHVIEATSFGFCGGFKVIHLVQRDQIINNSFICPC